ncbi:MAG: hypothetical protein ACYDBJ_12850 [Aggregatilineales bacterium]
MTETSTIFDMLGTGLFSAELEQAFLEWCVVQTVRPAFAHALTTHDLAAEGRLMMAATDAEAVAKLSLKIGEGARATMFRQLALWIKRATQRDDVHAAWEAAREAAIWSLIYSQRARDLESQVEQYQQLDRKIRLVHASHLREIAGFNE